jgi:anthranilate phosphoribosyltransferase
MQHAIGPRRDIGIRTIFNILGPLTNPAGADCQVLGVYREELVEKLAYVLKNLGCRRGFVVHGLDGMDEITLTGQSRIAEVTSAGVKVRLVSPEEFGLERCSAAELHGGGAVGNALIVKDVLSGSVGPRRRIVLLNAAFGLVAAGRAADVLEGIRVASEAIDSGRGARQLERLIEITNE